MNRQVLYFFLAAAFVASAFAVTCYDCTYSVLDKATGTTHCNMEGEIRKDKNKTCNGFCSTTVFDKLTLVVTRDCEEDCQDGPNFIEKLGDVNKTCCATDFCNDEIFSGAPAFKAPFFLCILFPVLALFQL